MKICFSTNTQNIHNIGTVKHGPAQVDNIIRTVVKNFPEATRNGIVKREFNESGHASKPYSNIGKPLVVSIVLPQHSQKQRYCVIVLFGSWQ